MDEVLNEAVTGSEDAPVSEAPLSIRDNLKAAMETETAEKPEKSRDESGRFATKTVENPAVDAAKPVDAPTAPKVEATAPVVPAVASETKVPPGWSPEAKAAFDTLPPQVREAISKREQEIDNGFKVLQHYKGLEEFTPLVQQAGTTHADVMRRAVGWEHALKTDPINTVIHAARVGNVDIIQLAQAMANGQIPQPQVQQPQQQPANIESAVELALRKRDTENQIQAFFSDPANVHAEAVADDMAALIKTGRATSIKDAYDAACWMRPDIRQQLISQTATAPAIDPQIQQRAVAADQARKASKSITGSSAPGPSANAGSGQIPSIRDSLRDGFAAARGRV